MIWLGSIVLSALWCCALYIVLMGGALWCAEHRRRK